MPEHESNQDHTRSFTVLSKGSIVYHYRIVEKIGAGGMGEVYLAEDTKLNRRVALKFLPAHIDQSSEIRARFVREAQTLARLNHPNIVAVYEVNEFEGRPFYAMELIEGETLHDFTHGKSIPVDRIVDYAIQMCQGLADAHRAGIVHRDIKASNVALDTKGRIRLLDFGLAAHEGDDKLTRTGSTLGTIAYMSPEQVSGRDVDNRSDLFSLGVVLYELIAQRNPFKRDNEGATLRAIMEDAVEPLARFKSNVPEKLGEIVEKLLDKDKETRYQSAEGVIADLKRLQYDSVQTGRPKKPVEKSKGKPILIGAVAVVFLAIVTIAGMYLYKGNETPKVAADSTPMIAVLPFENLGAADDDYFADGITDEITSRLASIQELGVISRTSAMRYKESNKSHSDIAKELGVTYLVEGTIRWSKTGSISRVRITPQLVRVSDDRPLWADSYERDLSEVFTVQSEIASKIVDQLGIRLAKNDQEQLMKKPTDNPEAYDLYLRALSQWSRFEFSQDPLKFKSLKSAIDSAVALDPGFALAHALRSRVYAWKSFGTALSDEAKISKASAELALRLQPGLSQGHVALGLYYNLVETDYDRALAEFNKAKSELQNDPELLSSISVVLMRQGHFDEAAANFRKAAELDPLTPSRHFVLSMCLRYLRAYEESDAAIDRGITLEPGDANGWSMKILFEAQERGNFVAMREAVQEALNHCDSFELYEKIFAVQDSLPSVDWVAVRDHFENKYKNVYEPLDYFSALGAMDYQLGDSVRMRKSADSARGLLERKLQTTPDDWEMVSQLGVVYAALGDCDRATEFAQRGADSLSIDKCHW